MDDSAPARAHRPPAPAGGHPHHWRRDLVELAALFVAVTVADSVAKTVVHQPHGPELLIGSAVALLTTAGWQLWWARRRGRPAPAAGSPPAPDPASASGPEAKAPLPGGSERGAPTTPPRVGTSLWRMRTTVREEPGSLAALCTALAEHRIDVLAFQSHPLGATAVDEFLLDVPCSVERAELTATVAAAGGRGTWLERADPHELVDAPTRALELAARTALRGTELPLALRRLLSPCTVVWEPEADPAVRAAQGSPPESPGGWWEETRMRLRSPGGGTLVVRRHQPPFTPTEFARAHALVDLAGRLGGTPPRRHPKPGASAGDDRPVTPAPGARGVEGVEGVTLREAGPRDLAAAREMHRRCSVGTLQARYQGSATDADRYLGHLLTPRFGRSLGVVGPDGQLVALGHLLWDGAEAELTVLVEDAWQGRGLGSLLLARLTALAAESGSTAVYAVTRSPHPALVGAMRRLGRALEFDWEDSTLVVSASLAAPHGGEQPAGRSAEGVDPSPGLAADPSGP